MFTRFDARRERKCADRVKNKVTAPLLLAAGFNRWDGSEIRGQLIGRERFNVHLDETDERAAVIGTLPAATVHDYANAGHPAAVRAHDIDGFLHAAAASDDIFGNDETLVRPDLKTAAQDQSARLLFDEDMSFAQRSSNFLSNDDSAKGRGDNGVAFDVTQFVGQPSADVRGDVGVLKQDRALKELPAMQAGAQYEMTVQERAGFSEEREQVLAH